MTLLILFTDGTRDVLHDVVAWEAEATRFHAKIVYDDRTQFHRSWLTGPKRQIEKIGVSE